MTDPDIKKVKWREGHKEHPFLLKAKTIKQELYKTTEDNHRTRA